MVVQPRLPSSVHDSNQRTDKTVVQQRQKDIKLNLCQKEVLKITNAESSVQVGRLAKRLNSTAQTIQRDLNLLTDEILPQ